MELRIGQGIDTHRLVTGRKLVLGGVEIPHHHGLDGHSDADALLHAITDAILGAAGLCDIGTYFPNTDAQWKGASSLVILSEAWKKVKNEGWQLVNLDSNILVEAPKLSSFVPTMKEKISSILGVSVDKIGIKVGTTEKLGFVGREEGVMAWAVVLLERAK